ncbi:hypothetical protein [Micromonospora cremea]|nr:hypothetical protein [Micromonospora cremea]
MNPDSAVHGQTIIGIRADQGRVLVRVSGKVKPSLAKKVEAALAGL